jgi:hypothetical protein
MVSYHVAFRYKEFDHNLTLTAFKTSTLVVSSEHPVTEPQLRHWTTIIRELYPAFHKVEIVEVKAVF